MFACPHCEFPIAGKAKRNVDQGTAETRIVCVHCEAILRIEITTLREPNPAKLEKAINSTKPATTYCSNCGKTLNVQEYTSHKCPELVNQGE